MDNNNSNNNSSSVLPIVIIGLIVVGVTLAGFFLLNFGRTAVGAWALAFLLLAEVMLFGGLIVIRLKSAGHAPVFMKAGISTALVFYFFAAAINAFVSRFFTTNLNSYVFLQLATFAFFAIIIIALAAVSRRIYQRNMIDADKVGTTEAKRGGF